MLYGCYRNGQIKIQPKDFIELCRTWIDPDTNETISGLENASPESLAELGIFPAKEITPKIDLIYEDIQINDWAFNKSTLIFEKFNDVIERGFEIVKDERILAVRKQCRTFILAVINEYHQLDVALGIMPDLGYKDWIASMITESNRCEDLYDSAQSIDDLKKVVPTFPEYKPPKE